MTYPIGGVGVFAHNRNLWGPSDIVLTTSRWDTSVPGSISDTGGAVDQIDDLIGTQNLTQTGGARPTTGTRTIGGRNVFETVGLQFMEKLSFPVDGSGDVAFYMVAEIDSHATASSSIWSMNGQTSGNGAQFDANSGAINFDGALDMNGANNDKALTGGPFQGPSIYEAVFDRAGSNAYNAFVDGFLRTPDTFFNANLDTSMDLRMFTNRGGSASMTGAFGEIIISQDVTLDTRYKIEGYLAHRWFGADELNNLPYDHPHKHFAPLTGVTSVPLWTPILVATGLRWYDCADPDALIEGTGGVETILNKGSGTAQDLTQSNTGLRPTSTGVVNGHTALDFSANDFLETLDASISSSGNHFTFMAGSVTPPTGTSSASMFSYLDNNGSAEDFQYDSNNTTNFIGRVNTNGIGSNIILTGGPFHDFAIHNLRFDFSAGIYNATVNGIQRGVDTTYSTPLDNTDQTLKVYMNRGTSQGLAGLMGEFIRHTQATVDARDKITGYLCWKWGTEGDLPSDHPYKKRPPTIND